MKRSRTMLKGAILIGLALLLAGCYTVLTHPRVADDQLAEAESAEETPVETSRSCSDCHPASLADPYYHWPFHYYDPPVGSWVYREYFYGQPFYSVTYYDRHRYYSSYPWWWNTRFQRYRYHEPARYSYPKPKPEKRAWDGRPGFNRPLPTVGSGVRKPDPSSSDAQPKGSPPRISGRRPISTQLTPPGKEQRTPAKVAPAPKEEDEEDEEDEEKEASQKKKPSSGRKGIQ